MSLRDAKKGPAFARKGKYPLGGGWTARQWKDWLRLGAVLPSLNGEKPAEEFLAPLLGYRGE